jgi:hypothetical protein
MFALSENRVVTGALRAAWLREITGLNMSQDF